MKLHAIILASALALVAACGGDSKDKALYAEASKFHNEALGVHNEVMPLMDQVDSLEKLVATKVLALKAEAEKAKGKADTTQLVGAKRTLEMLATINPRMEEWMMGLVEVPGNDHDHHHGEGHEHHDHDHAAAPQITAQQMVEVQKASLTTITQLRDDTRAAMEQASQLLK